MAWNPSFHLETQCLGGLPQTEGAQSKSLAMFVKLGLDRTRDRGHLDVTFS